MKKSELIKRSYWLTTDLAKAITDEAKKRGVSESSLVREKLSKTK